MRIAKELGAGRQQLFHELSHAISEELEAQAVFQHEVKPLVKYTFAFRSFFCHFPHLLTHAHHGAKLSPFCQCAPHIRLRKRFLVYKALEQQQHGVTHCFRHRAAFPYIRRPHWRMAHAGQVLPLYGVLGIVPHVVKEIDGVRLEALVPKHFRKFFVCIA